MTHRVDDVLDARAAPVLCSDEAGEEEAAMCLPRRRYGARWLVALVAAGALAMPAHPARVASASGRVELSPDEKALVADVKDGRFATWSFAEAALLASGVTGREQRRAYLDRLDALERQAAAASSGARTPLEKGEKLLGWLHGKSGALKKYQAKQTNLSDLLDTGLYNCVSSAVAYNVLGRRQGLDLRAIEVPDHVFATLYDGGERVDVETTTPRGFNPSRDKAAMKEFQELTGFTYIPARHRNKQREIQEAGLVAAIYYNHGVELARSKDHREAFHAQVRAMRLDPGLTAAAKNASAALASWSGELARPGQVEAALDLVRQNVTWLDDPAAERRLIQAVYDSRGGQLQKEKDWQAMADLYVKALERHRGDGSLARHFEHNAVAAYDAWAKPLVQSKKWPEAIEVTEKALARFPDNKHLQRNLKYLKQQRDR
jgi:tetratricopeptide (TPR) repeat protein